MLRRLVQAGMNVARINFSHGTHAEHAETIARIRTVAAETEIPVAVLADLQGPKLRAGSMVEAGVQLIAGEWATLTTEDVIGSDPGALPVQYDGLPGLVAPGDAMLLDDGRLELRVLSTTETSIHCRILVGGILRSNKGINLPGASSDIPSITEKDRNDLAFALAHGVDWVALSFVRAAAEVQELKRLICQAAPLGPAVPVMAKIEKPAALDNIDEIIAAADALMVARGDLGIETAPEMVPLAQKRIIRACNQAGVPVVTATQMLDSMIDNPRPTRAEASDVANAILDGTDAIMLSGETSIGAYPLHAVHTMVRVAVEVEEHGTEALPCPDVSLQRHLDLSTADAVSLAARETAHALDAAAIITPTVSGYTARLMSHHRPLVPIVAVTPSPAIQRQLVLYWGVVPLVAPRADTTDEIIAHAIRVALAHGVVTIGDTVVLTAGAAGSTPGTTNLMKVQVISATN